MTATGEATAMSDREDLAGLIGDKTLYWAADVILASGWLRERDRRIKAEALREAADELQAGISTLGIAARSLASGKAFAAAWLRDRADEIDGGAL